MHVQTRALGKLAVCYIGEVGPLKGAGETTEVGVDWKGRELVLIVTQDRAVYHHVAHSATHKGPTGWRLEHWTTCWIQHGIIFVSTCTW